MKIVSKLLILGAALAVSTSCAYADTLGAGTIGFAPVFGGAQIQWTATSLYYNPFGNASVNSATGSLLSFGGASVGVNGFYFSSVSAATPVEIYFTSNGTDTLEYYLTSLTVLTDTTSTLSLTGDGYFTDSAYSGDSAASLTLQASLSQSSGFTSTSFETTSAIAPTPEPGSLMLLGTGLLSVAGIARKKFASKLS